MTGPKSSELNQGVSTAAIASIAERPVETSNYFPQLVLPLPQPGACVVCGAPFEIVRQRGRPQSFCSDDCRAAQHKQQKLTWQQNRRPTNG